MITNLANCLDRIKYVTSFDSTPYARSHNSARQQVIGELIKNTFRIIKRLTTVCLFVYKIPYSRALGLAQTCAREQRYHIMYLCAGYLLLMERTSNGYKNTVGKLEEAVMLQPYLYARFLCSRAHLATRPRARATIGYLVDNNRMGLLHQK